VYQARAHPLNRSPDARAAPAVTSGDTRGVARFATAL